MTSIRPSTLFRHLTAWVLSCGALAGLAGFTGCAPKTMVPLEPQMTSPDKIVAMRESMQKSKPGSLVGQVVATFELYAAVTEIPVIFVLPQTPPLVKVNSVLSASTSPRWVGWVLPGSKPG